MKTILVTGSNGLLGQKIIYALRNKDNIRSISTSRGVNRMKAREGYIYESLDLTHKSEVIRVFEKYKPDTIINTAAMTNVDTCETKREEAWIQNVTCVENLIECCQKFNSHFIQLSTDFVFNGLNGPYIETDETDPLSYYAITKLEAEKKIEKAYIAA